MQPNKSTSLPNAHYRVSIKLIIKNSQNELLVLLDSETNTWELPGGGLDHGESINQAAKREITEELGVEVKHINRSVVVIEPGLNSKNKRTLKIYYNAELSSHQFKHEEKLSSKFVNKNDFLDLEMLGDESPIQLHVDKIWPKYIEIEINKAEMYHHFEDYLSRLESIVNDAMQVKKDGIDTRTAFLMAIPLYSVMEAIGHDIYDGIGLRAYIVHLGYSRREADLFVLMHRNGQVHTTTDYYIQYDSFEVYSMTSVSGQDTEKFDFVGLESKNLNLNVDSFKAIDYQVDNKTNTHMLAFDLSGLIAHVLFDLRKNQKIDTRKTLKFRAGLDMRNDAR